MYIGLEYYNTPQKMKLPCAEWSANNLEIFTLNITLLSVICVARAGYSVAEIFKATIVKTLPIEVFYSKTQIKESKKANTRSRKRRR